MVYEICLYISKPNVKIILYKIPVYFQFHKFWIIYYLKISVTTLWM